MANNVNQKPRWHTQLPDYVEATLLDSEHQVLAACLCNVNAMLYVTSTLQSRDFYHEREKLVYETIVELAAAGQGVTETTVRQRLAEQGKLDAVGGPLAILDLTAHYISSVGIENTVQFVKNQAIRHRLMEAGLYIHESAVADDVDVDELLDKSQALIDRVADHKETDIVPVGDHTEDAVQSLLDRVGRGDRVTTGLLTGFSDVDRILGGLQQGEILLVGGATGMGKTVFGVNIAQNAALYQNVPTAILSLEMSKKQLTKRILCSIAGIPSADLGYVPGSKKEYIEYKLREAQEKIKNAPLYIIDSTDVHINWIVTTCRRLKHIKNLGLVVLDYIQLVQGSANVARFGKNLEMGEVSRKLKQLALGISIPIIELSQINRTVDSSFNKRPTLASIRDSGCLPQDADKIILLFREDYYGRLKDDYVVNNILTVDIAKNRDGCQGVVSLYFDAATTTMRNLDKKDKPVKKDKDKDKKQTVKNEKTAKKSSEKQELPELPVPDVNVV